MLLLLLLFLYYFFYYWCCFPPLNLKYRRLQDKMMTFYLRVVFISSRYLFSHACVLMARIPPTASLMVEMRWSDTSAVRRRSCALAEDNRTKYGIRNSRKRTPISACQPIRYTTKHVDTVISVVKGTTWAIYMGASSIRCKSLDTRSITWPVVKSINVCLLRRVV